MLLLLGFLATCGIGFSAFMLLSEFRAKVAAQKREQDTSRRVYELAILREIGDRIGYSLDINQIADIITSSLHQFIEYSAVSYMLVEPDKVVFKMHLERSVDRRFVNDVRERMLKSLNELSGHQYKPKDIRELLSGAILLEDIDAPVRSLFNIPLMIGEKVVGILTVADTKPGLYKEEEMTILRKLIQQASKAVTRLQAVVKTEQEKVSAMVESMEDGVVMTDADYHILVINPAAKRMIGKEHESEISIFDFIDNLGGKIDMHGRLEESVKLKKSYESERFELNGKFYQAAVFPVKTETRPDSEDVLGGVVIFHDVSREVELERVREEFTSMIVHELRTPLSGIQKSSELLRRPAKKTAAQTKQFVDLIHQNSSAMLDLVDDILDAAKIQAGKFEIAPQPADIEEIIENRKTFFEVTASERHIKLQTIVEHDIPKTISLDVQRIKQVLNNLMSNALKFTADNGSVTVSTFVHEPAVKSAAEKIKALKIRLPSPIPESVLPKSGSALVVVVTDNGVGIEVEQVPKLFNKFQQTNNAALVSTIKGTGLGLAIAKGIVESHHGSIGVVSQVGVGSSFYFVIPFGNVQMTV